MSKPRPTVMIVGASISASLSIILQILPPLFLTPFFMRIDFVAVPWILCWMIFGLPAALLSMAISIPLVGLIGPFAGGWPGAVMKSAASIWMFLIPALLKHLFRDRDILGNKWLFVGVSIVAVLVRDIVTIFFNLYIGIPFFFQMTPEEVIGFFSTPKFQSFLGLSLGLTGILALIGEIALWNTVQGIIDLYTSLGLGLALRRSLRRSLPLKSP